MQNVFPSNHPLVAHKLTILRNNKLSRKNFGSWFEKWPDCWLMKPLPT